MPLKGFKHTEETRKKMSVSRLGACNPNFGKHWSEKHKKKLSAINSGCIVSEETKKKISANHGKPMLGKHHSSVSREKISRNHADISGINNPNYGKFGIHNSNYGTTRTIDTKRKIRIATLRRIQRDNSILAIGRNETLLIDAKEKLDGVRIVRQYPIQKLGYIVDGYCVETNTVYEVYERRHLRPKVASRDAIRQKEIQSLLGCKFVIIWDTV